MDALGNIVTEILEIITTRYVTGGRAMSADILKLKDETMSIYEKSRGETNPAVMAQYEQRLNEIREIIVKGEQQ